MGKEKILLPGSGITFFFWEESLKKMKIMIKRILRIKGIKFKRIDTILVQRNEVNAMATDSVCLMIVDEDDARFTSTYKDTKYYFCCNWCKKKFDENPKKYSRIAYDLNIEPGGASC